jgi:hypothetical protein
MQTNKSTKSMQTIQCQWMLLFFPSRFCRLLCLREGERMTQHSKTSLPSFVMTKRRQNLSSPAGPLYRASVKRLGYTPKAWTGLSPHVVRDNSGFLGRTSKFRAIQPIASKSPRRSPFDPSNEGITSILPESLLYTAFVSARCWADRALFSFANPLRLASRFSVNKRWACFGFACGWADSTLFWFANPLRLASRSYLNEQWACFGFAHCWADLTVSCVINLLRLFPPFQGTVSLFWFRV